MSKNYFIRVQKATQTRFWINNITREEADVSIAAGAVGCTQNPSYTWKMLDNSKDSGYAKELLNVILRTEKDDTMALVTLQRELVRNIAEKFRHMYEESQGKLGYVSIQGSPFEEDAESILRFARFNREAGLNIMAKIPATEDGLKSIGILAAEEIPINATECMAVRQVIDACETYVNATKNMNNPAPMYFSLITGIYDEYLHKQVEKEGIDIDRDVLWQAGMSIAKKVHALVAERCYPCEFIGGGARGLHHFTEMVGANAAVTINWKGTADKLIELDQPVVCRFLQPTPFSVEDELVEKLEDYRKAYFIHSIEPAEYDDFGPVKLFRSSFESAWRKSLEYIKSCR